VRAWLAIAGFAALGLIGTPTACAALQPLDLSVDGGEENWHAQRSFALRWSNPPGQIAAVHYRVLDPFGKVAVAEATLGWAATAVQHLSVPPTPGAYTAEVWLEDSGGAKGAPVTAKLRFDDAPPGSVEPAQLPAWVGRTAFPVTLHLGHSAGPAPLSGIRGYAASIDGLAGGGACLVASTCGGGEVRVDRGAAEDSLTLAELPEGQSYLHAVAVSGSGTRSALPSSAILHVDKTDPVTRLAGNPSGWSNRPLTLTATAVDAVSGMVSNGGGEPFTAIRIDRGAPVSASGDEVSATMIASGIHSVAYYARDAAGNVADGGSSNGHPDHAPAVASVKIDREPPSVAFAGSQNPLDPERIEARVSDSLSGPDPARGTISVRPVGSRERFAELPTERSGSLLRARWDSEGYPRGEYEFRATAYDAAGNSASTQSKVDGSPMRLSNPLKVATTLLSGFGGSVLDWHRCTRHGQSRRCHEETIQAFERRPSERTVPYGRGIPFSGRLVAGRNAPLAAMPVQLIERFDPGALPRERVTMVKTNADGAFNVRLSPGPSRDLVAVTAPTANLRGASGPPLRLSVRGGVRMRVSSTVARVGGGPVVFRGDVATGGAAMPTDGKAVQLQFRLPGLPWSEFRTVRTDPHGHFRYAYRFADDDSRGVRFQFRAFAPAQAGWPFEPAGSAPVAVLGR